MLTDTAKPTQQRPQTRAQTRAPVAVRLSNPVTIGIARPLLLTRNHRFMHTAVGLAHPPVAGKAIGIQMSAWWQAGSNDLFTGITVGMLAHKVARLPGCPAQHPEDRRAVLLPGAPTLTFIAPTPGRVR